MAAIPYKDSKGKRLPGVTTIISQNLGWNNGALMYWAWSEGMEGRNFRDTSQKACDIGSLVHSCIEADIHNRPWPEIPEELKMQVDNALLGWLHWKDTANFEPIRTEISLIDETLGFGGTMDLVAVTRQNVLSDHKSSKGIYPDHKIQIASYRHLWDNAQWELVGGKLVPWEKPCVIHGLALLQVGKEDGSFHYHFWHELSMGWEVFECLLKIHKLQKGLK